MFERFTDRARRILVLAQEEARMLNHDYIGTEHILLALIHEGDGVAARALESLDITEDAVREQVVEITGRGKRPQRSGHIPFTRQAKKVLELSLREALKLGHNYIGTEHILLGLIREEEGPAAQVLGRLGAPPERVRPQVIGLLPDDQNEPGTGPGEEHAGESDRATRSLFVSLRHRLDAVESRLSLLEHRVGTGPDVRDLAAQIAQVRRDKEAAIDAQDFENAAVLRDREKELLAERASRQDEWAAAHTDLPALSEEVERLRGLLRQHGIDPQNGAA